MNVKGRVDSIYRKLNPSELMQEWITFLREADAICQSLDSNHVPLTERELLLAARDASRVGKKPAHWVAQTFIKAVRDNSSKERRR